MIRDYFPSDKWSCRKVMQLWLAEERIFINERTDVGRDGIKMV